MGLNRPIDRPFFVIGGAVKTTGGSQNLVKGQLALVDNSRTTQNGVQVVATSAGKAKNLRDFALRLGVTDKTVNRSSNNFAQSTSNFALNEVVDLRVSAPERTEQSVDEIIVGYDGVDPNTAFNFRTGDSYFRFTLELEGGGVEWRGAGDGFKELVSVNVEIPRCDPFENCEECDECAEVDCRAITEDLIKRLRRFEVSSGAKVEEFAEITPVYSCQEDLDLTPYQYFTLDVCDTGTDNALALVQAQYDYPVIRINRVGATSTYQVLKPQAGGAPGDYEQTVASIIKGCEDCPAGYDPAVGGYVYAFTATGTLATLESAIEALPNYIADSLVTSGTSAGVHYITALFEEAIVDATITTFLGTWKDATITLVGKAKDLCENDTVTEISWNDGDVCNVTEEKYEIVIPDDECGSDRLAEIQGKYPNLTIAVADSDTSSQAVTLTGTSGTANITIDSVDYLATFDTDLTTTADNFVTTHAADILAAHGLTVTAAAGVLTFTGLTEGFEAPSVDNVSGDLDGTVADAVVLPFRQACQTKYETIVVSNMVCEECDPIFKNFYLTEAPDNFDVYSWSKVEVAPTGEGCLCGIRIKGKTFVLNAEEALRDQINFVEDSVRVRAAADYPEEIREGIGRLPKSTAKVTQLSRFIPRTHLGGNLRKIEDEGRPYFRDLHYYNDYLSRLLTGTVSNIEDQLVQYVHYTLVVEHTGYNGGFARKSNQPINYDIYVEVGRHQDVENLLNDIAANAGVLPVQAFA